MKCSCLYGVTGCRVTERVYSSSFVTPCRAGWWNQLVDQYRGNSLHICCCWTLMRSISDQLTAASVAYETTCHAASLLAPRVKGSCRGKRNVIISDNSRQASQKFQSPCRRADTRGSRRVTPGNRPSWKWSLQTRWMTHTHTRSDHTRRLDLWSQRRLRRFSLSAAIKWVWNGTAILVDVVSARSDHLSHLSFSGDHQRHCDGMTPSADSRETILTSLTQLKKCFCWAKRLTKEDLTLLVVHNRSFPGK